MTVTTGQHDPQPAMRAAEVLPEVDLAPAYLRLVLRVEQLAGNAHGARKAWVHKAHDEAMRHLDEAVQRP